MVGSDHAVKPVYLSREASLVIIPICLQALKRAKAGQSKSSSSPGESMGESENEVQEPK